MRSSREENPRRIFVGHMSRDKSKDIILLGFSPQVLLEGYVLVLHVLIRNFRESKLLENIMFSK